jgi:diacylglycerol kinase family enzyme
MHLALVINRAAGTFRRLPLEQTVEAIVGQFRQAGHEVAVEICGRRDLAAKLSALAMRPDIDAVIAGGGDGTILTAVLAGIGRTKPLGLLPLGTLNLLARDIGLPLDPVAAAKVLAGAHEADIDLGEVNGLPFAIWASLGMHPRVVRRRDRLQREGLAKWPAFALAALRAFRRYPMVTVTLSIGGNSTTVSTPLLVISNNAWHEQTLPLKRQALDRGELVVHVAKCNSRLSLLWLAFNALIGRWRVGNLLETFTAHEVRVTGRKRRVMLSLDGEVTVLSSPLVFRVNPKALRMLVPAPTRPEAGA